MRKHALAAVCILAFAAFTTAAELTDSDKQFLGNYEKVRAALAAYGVALLSGPVGSANLAILISGPNGKGTIYVVAAKTAGRWEYSTLNVEVEKTGERIDLNRR